MSVGSAFKSAFKNFGHAIASGAKSLVAFSQEAPTIAAKLAPVEQDAAILLGALVGPQASKIADLGFHLVGDVANALSTAGQIPTTGNAEVRLQLDANLIAEIQQVSQLIQTILNSKGATVPAPAAG